MVNSASPPISARSVPHPTNKCENRRQFLTHHAIPRAARKARPPSQTRIVKVHRPLWDHNEKFRDPPNFMLLMPADALVTDELEVLESLVPLEDLRLIEAGCGQARMLRQLLQRHVRSQAWALEVDRIQHARNVAQPQDRLTFVAAGAQSIPADDACFDLALMLKSLHHVPGPLMDTALEELARVVKPGGWLYVSEPVYDGALNEIVRLYNDEGVVRALAQDAVDRSVQCGRWRPVAERRFEMPAHFPDFAAFEQRMMRPTYADHRLDDAKVEAVRRAFEPHMTAQGASFTRPMHVRLLQRPPAC